MTAGTDPALAAWIEQQLRAAPPLDERTAQAVSVALFGGGRDA